MRVLLASARGPERVNKIPNLPKHTEILYDYEGNGFWASLSKMLKTSGYTEPFVWLADDIRPHPGWYEKAKRCYEEHFPTGLGLVTLNDLWLKDGGCAFGVLTTRWLWVLFRKHYFPSEFAHYFLDTLIANRSKDLGRYVFCEEAIVEHLHPEAGKAELDAVYKANKKRARENQDKLTKDEFDFDWENGGLAAAKALLEVIDD